jgi:hypothetical protein
MRILQCSGEHVVVLSDPEVQSLLDACALLILISGELPGLKLQPATALLIVDLIGHFRG